MIVGKKLALQLFTLREQVAADFEGTLKRIAAMGWKYVELAGGTGNRSAQEVRRLLDQASLTAVSAHVGIEPFEADFETEVTYWKTVGIDYVVIPSMMDECRDTLATWRQGAKRLDDLGLKLKRAGLTLMFHNHPGDLQSFADDKRTKLTILLAETSPEHLKVEIDTAWIHAGRVDPYSFIRAYKNRCPLIHLKDLVADPTEKKHPFAPLGQGCLNWPIIFEAMDYSGVQVYIFEQDECDDDPFKAVATAYQFLTK